jgi:sterol desaturase/sphingolipid hydroxylase (fatty acid hydroxylase superfamily)
LDATDAALLILAALSALFLGTLAEYFVHRFMHWGIIYPKGHKYHHESGDPRTYLRDFIDYGTGAVLVGWLGFSISVPVGIGWALGAFAYAGIASYAHQLQHANANLVFWMPRPVHRLHHVYGMTSHNFGILVDWWDRLFGTYLPVEWPRPPARRRFRDYAEIPWR